ncbi:hypothetical protein QE152_g34501 [Popillia japonica]|uniref:Uncharacterized protein n=1 Tax=Popillia japonica TaxID=7064 RepID=A0AAW1IU63_POPJA
MVAGNKKTDVEREVTVIADVKQPSSAALIQREEEEEEERADFVSNRWATCETDSVLGRRKTTPGKTRKTTRVLMKLTIAFMSPAFFFVKTTATALAIAKERSNLGEN